MAIGYTKKTWANGGPPALSAANLQALDDAVEAACDGLDAMPAAAALWYSSSGTGGSDGNGGQPPAPKSYSLGTFTIAGNGLSSKLLTMGYKSKAIITVRSDSNLGLGGTFFVEAGQPALNGYISAFSGAGYYTVTFNGTTNDLYALNHDNTSRSDVRVDVFYLN